MVTCRVINLIRLLCFVMKLAGMICKLDRFLENWQIVQCNLQIGWTIYQLADWAEYIHVLMYYWPSTWAIQSIITRHVTIVMQLANPRHPRPVHISWYWPLSQSNITRYGLGFDPEYNKKMEKSVGSLAVRVISLMLTVHAGNIAHDTCSYGCAVRACIYVLLTAARIMPSYTRPNGAAVRECIEYGISQSRSQ